MYTLRTLIFITTLLILTQSSVALSRPEAIESLLKPLCSRLYPRMFAGGTAAFLINNYYKKSSGNGPEISIKGTTAVEIASGLHWYLKYQCGAHVSWDKTGGVQIASIPRPGSLPLVKDKGVMIQRPVPWNYYQNVVTSSYSYVWWNWERWEKELDWMALQGINLPLAFTGQEAIWHKVFMNFNITTEDLNDFFGGPAFLAWARMGNLHSWGGPLPHNWLDQQLCLQKQILSRMLELGMTPVLPSFSGNVPAALKKIFPSANITRLGDWNTVDKNPRWCCTYLLNPSDPLFVEIGEAFIRQQVKEYGDVTDIYNCDTFNENSPPTSDPAYISSLGAAVYKAMSRGDKDAVWLMQGWLFYSDSAFWKPPQMQVHVMRQKQLLFSLLKMWVSFLGLPSVNFRFSIRQPPELVKSNKLKHVAIRHYHNAEIKHESDLFAEAKPIWKNSSQFYGTPYVWCLLHNFGGNIEMYGILDAISSGPVDARTSDNSTMVGVGMCMEGIEQNPVVYELMSEMAFRSGKPQVLEWLKTYAHRRYGKAVRQVVAAWDILYHTVYNCTDGIADHNTDFIVKFPDWDPSLNFGSDKSQQDNMRWSRALWLFLDAGNDLRGSLTYRYDLVDLTRQVLSKLANQVYRDAMIAFRRKDARALNLHGQKFLQIIKDIDVLLASDDNFLLGTWLESAKKLAADPSDMKLYEWNARTQVTMWYDTTTTNQSQLHDYANKFWSGLLEDYYLPRASTYFGHLTKSLEENKNFKLIEWRKEWIAFSNKWQADTKIYPVKAKGDALAIAKALYKKYFG
ncbi:hypothetical protein OIU76_014924 [Salix suchowensis]|nr:hypothetical protein OIU76_014924 [Salix suchowensis]